MDYLERIIWLVVPALVNGFLIFLFRTKLPVPNKKYVILWLLSISIIGFVYSPMCPCMDYTVILLAALTIALLYSLTMFIFYVFVIFVRSKIKSNQ